MKQLKNITRFTYEFTSFQGWRVNICRKNQHFTRYFSDKQYGGEELAFRAAISLRNKIFEMLHRNPQHPSLVFQSCQEKKRQLAIPRGLRPFHLQQFA